MQVAVRAATAADLAPLARLDLTYEAGARTLALKRSGTEPELTFALSWSTGTPVELTYAALTVEGLRHALTIGADLFLVAEDEGRLAGYLMIVLPRWTDAGEITDLAVDRPLRRSGAGRELIAAAATWARARELRGLWVEPRNDNASAGEFYLSLGFRVSGLNDRWSSNDDDEATIYMYLQL